MSLDVRQYCETWARWAAGSRPGRSISLTGKLMHGLGSTTCRTCSGHKRVEGWKVGSSHKWVDPCPSCSGLGRINGSFEEESGYETVECGLCELKINDITGERRWMFAGETCPRCWGEKSYRIPAPKVNPAGIRATRYVGANEDNDPISEFIDGVIAGWRSRDDTFWMGEILIMEYTENGTQQAKARTRGLSQAWYSVTLGKAHERMEQWLQKYFQQSHSTA